MRKTAVLLYPQFSEYELSVALSILMQGKKPIMTIGTGHEIRGESGLLCKPDRLLSEVDIDEFDSLLLPGCLDIGELVNHYALIHFIKEISECENWIASISSSPYLLALAGALQGREYTIGLPQSFIQSSEHLDAQLYRDVPVVQDNHIITAIGSGFIEFGIRFGEALNLSFDQRWYRNEPKLGKQLH
ncbi:4-methyl-5(b-hydroxyethyl)-thiazole monophosphate biosynthesis [Alkalihalobacillus xiaoxiensis]|uniref:4-methyl-5(B-hydroxyethyl)-thiazole monophosphate biosynthesis n=1 Tax=Shouchella xiaoxiensis TaxID=766895 RepID=A0ABS2SNW4_9BACI|nr:DJ-1/PfpI family protein [Shouchella xiaoxiensis]MBM7837212.1 4-methyl-5(b-hydroxyethyl)-thiazole monophosphate biosynthesis [Shouchella xiaoxiensis]